MGPARGIVDEAHKLALIVDLRNLGPDRAGEIDVEAYEAAPSST
jgi:hypothetical protein